MEDVKKVISSVAEGVADIDQAVDLVLGQEPLYEATIAHMWKVFSSVPFAILTATKTSDEGESVYGQDFDRERNKQLAARIRSLSGPDGRSLGFIKSSGFVVMKNGIRPVEEGFFVPGMSFEQARELCMPEDPTLKDAKGRPWDPDHFGQWGFIWGPGKVKGKPKRGTAYCYETATGRPVPVIPQFTKFKVFLDPKDVEAGTFPGHVLSLVRKGEPRRGFSLVGEDLSLDERLDIIRNLIVLELDWPAKGYGLARMDRPQIGLVTDSVIVERKWGKEELVEGPLFWYVGIGGQLNAIELGPRKGSILRWGRLFRD